MSEEERGSFNIDNKDQVANFIQEAIEKKHKSVKARPSRNETLKMGLVMESMLDDGMLEDEMAKEKFGVDSNLEGRRYRDFVMDYVLDNNNYENAAKRYDAWSAALKTIVK